MIKIKTWKSYSLSVFFGLLLISLFIFSLIGFLNFSNDDVFFGSFSTDYENNKGLTYYSSFFFRTLTIFFGYTAYLIPLFFLMPGNLP